jgi:hypothetical protein
MFKLCGCYRGDDDINDVAAMGGVNLAEETQRILGSTEFVGTQIRSCKDEIFLHAVPLQHKIRQIGKLKVSQYAHSMPQSLNFTLINVMQRMSFMLSLWEILIIPTTFGCLMRVPYSSFTTVSCIICHFDSLDYCWPSRI